MGLKAKIEAIIYAAEEPITLEQISLLVKDVVLAEQAAEAATIAAEAAEAPASVEQSAPENPASEVAESVEASDESAAGSEAVEPLVEDAAVNESPADGEIANDASAVEEVVENAAASQGVVTETSLDAAPDASASVEAPEPTRGKRRKSDAPKKELSEDAKVRARVRSVIEELVADYDREERGMEIRQIAGGYRMSTKPEHHDVVRAFAKSLKPAVRLSLAALETLAVIAYKQPVTVPEISEIRGVESNGVIGTLLDRKLITTSGRKQVIGRPILYKTSKEFLLRFGLNEIAELPSMEEFEKLAGEGQQDLFPASGSEPVPPPDTEATLETGDSTEEDRPAEQAAQETDVAQTPSTTAESQPAEAGVESNDSADTAGSNS
jgi:segregation and condensation protein B